MTNLRVTNALIIGSSGGVGSALMRRLSARNGVAVRGLSRRADGLDITNDASVAGAANALKEALGGERLDLIINAVGILDPDGEGPEKSLAAIRPEAMATVFAVNAIGPALVLKHFAPLLASDRPAVFASLSARVGSIGDNRLGGWTSYRASKAALNQIIRCASVEIARTHEQAAVVALHPGTIETELTRRFARGRYTASPDEGADDMLATLAGLTPDQTGRFFAYDGQEIEW